MQLRLLCRFYDFFHGDFFGVVPILDIVHDATGKQHWFLGNDPNVRAEKLNIDFFAVMPIYHLSIEGTSRALSFRIPAVRNVDMLEVVLYKTFALLEIKIPGILQIRYVAFDLWR